MSLFKKIFKIFIFLIPTVIIIIIIDFHFTKISSADDISNLTKIKMYDDNNEVFYEILGDIVLEICEDNIALVEDYREDIENWLQR